MALRLAALEAQMTAIQGADWTPPELTDAWCAEVVALLQEYGYWESVLEAWGCDTP